MNIQDYNDKTDEEVFRELESNPDLFEIIIDRYEKKLSFYIKRNSGPDIDRVDDILQEVFLSVYQNAKLFCYDMKFSSWIYRITHNKMIDYWRKHKKGKEEISLDENIRFVETVYNHNNVLEDIEKIESKELVSKVILLVKEKYREVLILRFLEEKTYEEISDILEKSTGTVGTLISRAKKEFKKELELLTKKNK